MAWASKDKRNEYQRAYRLVKGVKPRLQRVVLLCPVCGSAVPSSNHRYCSSACHRVDTEERLVNSWVAGEFNPPHAGEGRVPEYIKRWWLTNYGERCILCGWAERRNADGRIPLSWDHMDGDCSNNRYRNIRLLCPNCHALTDTYGSLNKQSQRKRWGR